MTAADEREALYQAILDAPADNAPRLVYADWLEEYGDAGDRARAEFIRLQLALALRPGGSRPWVRTPRWTQATDETITAVLPGPPPAWVRAEAAEWSIGGPIVDYEMLTSEGGSITGVAAFVDSHVSVGGGAGHGETYVTLRRSKIDETHGLRCRERELLRAAFRRAWLRPAPAGWECAYGVVLSTGQDYHGAWSHPGDVSPAGCIYANFRRGFAAEAHAPLQTLLGHGPAVAAAHPVERMEASDKTPARLDESTFGWARSGPGYHVTRRPEEAVPELIFMGLHGRQEPGSRFWKRYPSVEAAADDLDEVMLAYCREEAAYAAEAR